jgi:uncharacterized membrane protein YphA (DoxX/SURF4 family)
VTDDTVASSLLGSLQTLDPSIDWMLRIVLAATFAMASFHKLRDMDRFREILISYRLPLGSGTPLLAKAIPVFELIVAISLIVIPGYISGAAALCLLLAYSSAIALNLQRGRTDLDCGCSGPAHRQPIGLGLLLRNALLAAMAALTMLPTSARMQVWLDAIPILLGAFVSITLFAGFEAALRNRAMQEDLVAGSPR